MSLKGSLATMPPGDLFEWLARRGGRGTLTMDRGAVTRAFDVDRGLLRSARSNLPGEGIGYLLLARGLVDEAALQKAIQSQAETGVDLDRVLLMVGAVDEAALCAALEERIREALADAMSWSEGAFVFSPRGEEGESSDAVVSLAEILPLAAAQVERRREIARVLPGENRTLWIADRERVPAEIAASVERGLSVEQMAMATPERFEALDRLARLVEDGALRVERRTRSRQQPDSELDPPALGRAAMGRAAGGDRLGAFDLARRAVDLAPEDPELRGLFQSIERSLLAELGRELLGRFRVPRVLVAEGELPGLPLDDVERRLIGRIDGRWDLLSLLQVTPLREVEILMACKRLAARGIISL